MPDLGGAPDGSKGRMGGWAERRTARTRTLRCAAKQRCFVRLKLRVSSLAQKKPNCTHMASDCTFEERKLKNEQRCGTSRGSGIRTHDLKHPKLAHYQAVLLPEYDEPITSLRK